MVNFSPLDKVNKSQQNAGRFSPRFRMERSQIHRVSIADQVALVLRQRILEGEFRPGTPLQELSLASSLGVSRNTMREALRILALEGLLRRNLHRGVVVSQLFLRDVEEIYQIRRTLEIPGVLAARKPDPDLLRQLRTAFEQYEASIQDRDWVRAVNFDFQFHSVLIRFHNNRRLETFYQKVIGELRMGMVLVDRRHDDPEGLVPVHRKMYQLLTSGKLKQCAAVLEQHLADSESRLSRVITTQSERSATLTT